MSSIPYPNAVAPASERRTFAMIFVGALHVAVIYTILVALNIAPSPLSRPDGGIVKWIEPKPTQVDNKPVTQTGPTNWAHPARDTTPIPDIRIDNTGSGDGAIHPQFGAGTGDVFQTAMAVPGTHTIPDYPALDRRLNHEGTVALNIAIDANGGITEATVLQSSGYDGLDAAAVAWVKSHWRYKPATKNGVAMPTTVRASVVFHLTTGRG
jgi:periplasmic protein TonB